MLAKPEIYLDSNAGASLHPKVKEALQAMLNLDQLANPSSAHALGRKSKRLLNEARDQVCLSLHGFNAASHSAADASRIIFTSSGTEANQLAIRSVLEPLLNRGIKPHWIISAVEHDSHLQMIPWLIARGGSVTALEVDSEGLPSLDSCKLALKQETALLSLIWVNNETGVILDPSPWTELAQASGFKSHLDGAQAWGKLNLELEKLGADFVSFSGHKIGAMAGTGVLWTKDGSQASSEAGTILGKQERGSRGGTENLLGIVSLGTAAAHLDPSTWKNRLQPLRDRFESHIQEHIRGLEVNAQSAARVANTSNLYIPGIAADSLILKLDREGYYVSAGSACQSGVGKPSHVLLAMGQSPERAKSSIRVSFSNDISWDILEGFAAILKSAVEQLRKV